MQKSSPLAWPIAVAAVCALFIAAPYAWSAVAPPPSWTVQYEGDQDPTLEGWACGLCGTNTSVVDLGGGNNAWHISDSSAVQKNIYQQTTSIPDLTTEVTVLTRVKYVSASSADNVLVCDVQTSDDGVRIYWQDGQFGVALGTGSFTQGMPANEYHVLRVTVDTVANTWQMFYDEGFTAIGSGTLGTWDGSKKIRWGAGLTSPSTTGELEVDYFYFYAGGAYVPACFITYSPAVPQVNETVQFTGDVSGAYGTALSSAWSFGDGGSDTVNPTTHAYTTAGTYLVSFTVTYDGGTTGTAEAWIRVNAAPTCSISGPTTGYTGIEYCYDGSASGDADGSIVSYFWDFDEGTPNPPAGTVQNPSFETSASWTTYGGPQLPDNQTYCNMYPRAGSYYLGNAVNGGTLSPQGAYQTVSGLSPGGSYRAGVWILTNGQPTPELVVCRIGVDPEGGTDPGGAGVVWSADAYNDGCPPSYLQISVDFTAGGAGTATIFCEFEGNNGGDSWNIVAMDDVDLVGVSGVSTENPGCYTFQVGGAHNVCLTVTDNDGGSTTCCQTVDITEVLRPQCDITYSPAAPSVQSTITFNANASHPDPLRSVVAWDWDFGDGGTGSGDPATHQYAADGAYTVTCTVTDDAPSPGPWTGSCVTQVTVVSPPVCSISGPSSVPAWSVQCYDGSGSYDPDGGSIVSYVWDFGAVSGRNFVRNGDFEGGFQSPDIEGDEVANEWTKFKADGDSSFWPLMLATDPTPHGGTDAQAVYWNELGTPVDAGIYQVVTGLTAGKVYQISQWARIIVPGTGTASLDVGYDLAGGTDPGGVDQWISLTVDGTWQEGVAQVTATGDKISVWYRYRCDDAVTVGDYWGYADDAALVEVSTGPSACHIFTETGTIPVSLTVTDDEGLTTTCTTNVTVGPPASQQPSCSFTVGTPTYTQVAISFDGSASADPDGTIVGYDWEFGDGDTASGNPTTHTYAAGSAGTYTVTLMVTDNTDTVNLCSQTVTVTNPAPVCSFTLPGGTPQPGQEVCFDGTTSSDANGAIVSYLWDFGVPADLTSSLLTNANFETGDFTGWTVQGDIAASVLASADPYCSGVGPPEGAYFAYDHWDAGGLNVWGQILQTTSTDTMTLVPGETYRVDSYVWSHSNCDEDPAVRVGVDPQAGTTYLSPSVVWSTPITPVMSAPCTWYAEKVSVSFTAETSRATVFLFYNHNNIYEGCSGSVAAFDDVKFYQQPSSTDPAPCYTFGAAGDYLISLTVTDDEGAATTCEQTLTVSGTPVGEPPECGVPPIIVTSDPSPPVKDTVITFNSNAYDPTVGGSIVSYQWNFGDGNTDTGNPTTHAYAGPGSYAVRCVVTDNDGNSVTCSVGVDVANAAPTCCISGPDYVVVGEEGCWSSCSTDIDGTIDSYLWTFGEGNLVVNGDFEGGFHDVSGDRIAAGSKVADGWVPWPATWGGDILFRAETTNQHGGLQCQAMDLTESSAGVYQVVSGTEAGKQYLFTAWLRYDTNAAGGPPWYELGWDVEGGTTPPPDPPAGPWVQFQPAITGLAYGSWYNNHEPAIDPKSKVLTATGSAISIWLKWGNIWDATARTGYVDDVSLLEFETTETVCHTYQTVADYTLELTVTDDMGATSTCSRTVSVLPSDPPTCSFTMAPSPTTINRPVTFTSTSTDDGTVTGWAWDFGDGNTDSGESVTHAYPTGGTYTVQLVVTDNDGLTTTCSDTIDVATTLDVTIPLTGVGWHMISLPLEPVDKNILLDRATGEIDPNSILYDSYVAGNDPRNRLFRIQPGVGYWTYNPALYPDQSWYELGVDPPVGKPHPGPWWQGFWFLVDVEHSFTYTAYPPAAVDVRFVDITSSPGSWAWMMMGACACIPDPYDPDVTTWPTTSMVTDLTWGKSTPPAEPTTWWPTAACPVGGADDAWDLGYVGLPLSGYITGTGYYTVSPSQVGNCGAPANTDSLTPGEGYWLDVEDLEVWLRVECL